MQGCPHHCDGCHNPDTHDISGGYEAEAAALYEDIISTRYIDGVTFSGGDPFCQPEELYEIISALQGSGLDIWCYTGWTFEELTGNEAMAKILPLTDVLVDGRFDISKTDGDHIYRGSSNQRLIDVKKTLKTGEIVLWED